jgi:hypothetical protein
VFSCSACTKSNGKMIMNLKGCGQETAMAWFNVTYHSDTGQEVLSSDLGLETGCPDWCFSLFSSVLPTVFRTNLSHYRHHRTQKCNFRCHNIKQIFQIQVVELYFVPCVNFYWIQNSVQWFRRWNVWTLRVLCTTTEQYLPKRRVSGFLWPSDSTEQQRQPSLAAQQRRRSFVSGYDRFVTIQQTERVLIRVLASHVSGDMDFLQQRDSNTAARSSLSRSYGCGSLQHIGTSTKNGNFFFFQFTFVSYHEPQIRKWRTCTILRWAIQCGPRNSERQLMSDIQQRCATCNHGDQIPGQEAGLGFSREEEADLTSECPYFDAFLFASNRAETTDRF